ncbi:hypothetical protein IWZ01DRAFT_119698 [Phyllosticta capitalensis]
MLSSLLEYASTLLWSFDLCFAFVNPSSCLSLSRSFCVGLLSRRLLPLTASGVLLGWLDGCLVFRPLGVMFALFFRAMMVIESGEGLVRTRTYGTAGKGRDGNHLCSE